MNAYLRFHCANQLKGSTWLGRVGVRVILQVALWILLILGAVNTWALEQSRMVTLKVRSDETGVYVDAQMDLVLPEIVHEALDKGIALHFVSTVVVERERWYWFDAVDVYESRTVKLSYQPLLQHYRVTIGGLNQTFSTLPSALNFVGNIAHWRIADAAVVDRSTRQILVFTFELDRKQLPRLFQLSGTGEQEWGVSITQQVDLSLIQEHEAK